MRGSRHLPTLAFGGAITLAGIGLLLTVRNDRASRKRIGRSLREVLDFLRHADTAHLRVPPSDLRDWMTADAVRRRVEG